MSFVMIYNNVSYRVWLHHTQMSQQETPEVRNPATQLGDIDSAGRTFQDTGSQSSCVINSTYLASISAGLSYLREEEWGEI